MFIDQIFEDALKPNKMKFIWPDYEEGEKMFHLFLSNLHDATCFDFADVATAYQNHRQTKDFIFARDVFCVLPPFPMTWCEAPHPSGKMGCLVQSEHVTDVSIRDDIVIDRTVQRILPESGIREVPPNDNIGIVSFRDVYAITMDYAGKASNGQILVVPQLMTCVADKQGQPLTHAILNPKLATLLHQPQMMESLYELLQKPHLMWFGFSLLACRNISTEEKQISSQLQKARTRRGKLPLKSYYVLNVSIDRKRAGGKENTETKNETIKKRLHMVRGSLADYSEGPGLFGKYKGRFWRPAHVRGLKDAGEIKKDYRVLSPKEKNEQ